MRRHLINKLDRTWSKAIPHVSQIPPGETEILHRGYATANSLPADKKHPRIVDLVNTAYSGERQAPCDCGERDRIRIRDHLQYNERTVGYCTVLYIDGVFASRTQGICQV
jgi:hypothetical protein